jgi:hypothetical protein
VSRVGGVARNARMPELATNHQGGGRAGGEHDPRRLSTRSTRVRACADRRVAQVSTGATKAVGSAGELLALG